MKPDTRPYVSNIHTSIANLEYLTRRRPIKSRICMPFRPIASSIVGIPHYIAVCLLVLLLVSLPAWTREPFHLDPGILAKAEKQYGMDARRRLLAWEQLIQKKSGASVKEKLRQVNTFFNKLTFVDDILHWHKKDYWATPVELLASGGGDCEDFALAKYFTLKALGVEEQKLNLTYVKALRLNQAHMVLTYYSTPGTEPLILDNLVATIQPASLRPDLLPVYSFNGVGLWLSKERGRGRLLGGSERLKRWQNLLERMPDFLH